jgi:hypothetical protein
MMGTRGSAHLDQDAIVMHPDNWQTTRLLADSNGQLFGGGPFTGPYGGPQGPAPAAGVFSTNTLWNVPVVLPDERGASAVAFLRRAIEWFKGHGVAVRRVMTDNGSAYVSAAHTLACRELGVRHLRTRPYRPRTNGKAERFIQTLLREWAYGRIYGSSAERTAALPAWMSHCNFRRPHGSLGHQRPGSRLNNLLGDYS